MDLDKVENLILLMKKHGLTQLSVEEKDFKVKLGNEVSGYPAAFPSPMMPTNITTPHAQTPVAEKEAAPSPAETKKKGNYREIKSPFVGTFYAASGPGEDPFVSVGSQIKKGDTLCIVEAMKLMNEIEADCDGRIVEILVQNEEPIEFSQTLFLVE